jgi:glutathione peroxidase-family protein
LVVDRSGRVVKRHSPTDTPETLQRHIEELL